MSGVTVVGGDFLSNPGPGWQVAGTGDFDGDGNADILWQNADGTPAIWLMNGTPDPPDASVPLSSATLGSESIQFIGDSSASATLIATAGQDTFDFTSSTAGAHSISGFDPTQDLVELSKTNFSGFADLEAHSSASGGGTLITFDGANSLLIQGVQPSDLNSSNFVFV